MKNVVLDNSAIVQAGLRYTVLLKEVLKKADGLLGTVNKYSVVDGFFRSAACGGYKVIGKLYAGATLIRATGAVISRCLRIAVKSVTGFFYSIYYGSFVMEMAGKAAVNSRWIK